jgi:hypothetical protein
MMTLVPTAFLPAHAWYFRSGAAGLTVASGAGSTPGTTPNWISIDDPALRDLDFTNACTRATGAGPTGGFNLPISPFRAGSLIAVATNFAAPRLVIAWAGGAIEAVGSLIPQPASPAGRPSVSTVDLSDLATWSRSGTGAPASAEDLAAAAAGALALFVTFPAETPVDGPKLFALEIHDPLREALVVSTYAQFEDGALCLGLPPSLPYASGFVAEVRDAAGAVLLTRTIGEDGSESVVLSDPSFTPQDGATYGVRVRLLGQPGPDALAELVVLTAPTVTAAGSEVGLHADWTAVASAASYVVRVTGPDGFDTTWPVAEGLGLDIGQDGSLTPGADYQVTVRAVAATTAGERPSLGPWSAAATARARPDRMILRALLDRLGNPASGGTAILDSAALAASAPGQPGPVLAALQAALGPAAPSLRLNAAPTLTNSRLTLTGAADLLGAVGAAVQADFTVSNAGALQLSLSFTPSPDWGLADGFPDLAASPWDDLPLSQVQLVVSTFAQVGDDGQAGVAAGLNLRASLGIAPANAPLDRLGDLPADAIAAPISGVITPGDRTTLALSSPATLPTLSATIAGLPPASLNGGRLDLGRTGGDTAGDRLQIVGTVTLGTATHPGRLDLATRWSAIQTLTLEFVGTAPATVGDLLAGFGAAVAPPALVAAVGAVAVGAVDALTLAFATDGSRPTLARATAALAADWSFAGALTLGGARLEISVPLGGGLEPALAAFSARLTGHVTVHRAGGDLVVSATVVIPAQGDWSLALASDPPLTFGDLTSLVPIEAAAFTGLPSGFIPGAGVGLSAVMLWGQPSQATITRASFAFVQTETWTLGDVAAVRDGALALDVAFNPTTISGTVSATVALRPGADEITFPAEAAFPPAAEAPWTIALADGQQVSVPGTAFLMGLFGTTHAAAPEGADTVTGLVLTRLEIAFDPSASPALQQLGFTIAQAGDWILLPPDQLKVSDLHGDFDLKNAGADLDLDLGGVITVLGAPIEARLYRENSAWQLSAVAGAPIAATGVANLDAWMSPEAFAGYLGAAAPAAAPVGVGEVYLSFSEADGALTNICIGLGIETSWAVVSDKVVIQDLYANLASPWPVSAAAVTGNLSAQADVFGATLLLAASKPDAATPWTFTGGLGADLDLNLGQSAASLKGGTFVAPALPGLPAQIAMASAWVTATPDTGYFRFVGAAAFSDLGFNFGQASLSLTAIGGEILIKAANAPVRARLTASMLLAGARADVFLQLGSDATVDTIVAGRVAADQMAELSLADAVDSAIGAGVWSGAPSPGGFAAPSVQSAAFCLNLTRGDLALFAQAGQPGQTSIYGDLTLLVRSPPAGQTGASGYTLLLDVQADDFRLAQLAPDSAPQAVRTALALVDGVVRLRRVSVALSSLDATDVAARASSAQAVMATAADGDFTPIPAPFVGGVGRGLNVYGELVVQGALWEAVSAVLDLQGAVLRMQALIAPDDPTATVFVGSLANFTLLSVVHFDALTVSYRPRAADAPVPAQGAPLPSVTIAGTGALQFGSTDLAFQGTFTFVTSANATGQDASAAAFAGALLQTGDIHNPLGIPNVVLHPASIAGAWVKDTTGWTRTRFQLEASATVCGLTLSAIIDMSLGDRQRVVVSLLASDSLSLSALLVSGLGASWAAGLVPDLSFSDGSLTYTAFSDTSQPSTYVLHAKAGIVGIDFLFNVQLTAGDGVVGSAMLASPLDFGFMTLWDPDKAHGPKASLTKTQQQTAMVLQTRAVLLGHDFDLSLAYVAAAGAAAAYAATVSTAIDLGALGSITPTVEISYEDGGQVDVSVKDFGIPLDQLKQAFDVLKAIQNFKGASGACPSLGDIFGDLITYDVKVGLAFPKLAPGTGPTRIQIGLDIVCTISLAAPVSYDWSDKVELNFIEIEIPADGLTFANVITAILASLPGALPNLISSFFSDPEAMAKLSALAAANAAVSILTDALLCHTSTPGGGGGGGSSPPADPRAAYVAAFVLATGLISFLLSIWNSLTEGDRAKKDKAERQKRDNATALANLTRPSSVALTYLGGSRFAVTCAPDGASLLDGEGVAFDFSLVQHGADNSQTAIPGPSLTWRKGDPAPTGVIDDPRITPGGQYSVQVLSDVWLTNILAPPEMHQPVGIQPYTPSPGGGMGGMFDWHAQSDVVASSSVVVPDFTPRDLAIEQIGGVIAVTFSPGPTPADHYTFAWLDGAQPPLPLSGAAAPTETLSPGQTQAPYEQRLALPANVDRLSVQVLAVLTAGEPQVLQAADTTGLDLARLPIPVMAPSTYDPAGNRIVAAWSAVDGATGYRLQRLSGGRGSTAAESIDLPTGTLTGALSAAGSLGQSVRLRVGAIGAGAKGVDWSEVQTVNLPGAVVSIALAAAPSGGAGAPSATAAPDVPTGPAVVLTPGQTTAIATGAVAAFTASRTATLVLGTTQVWRYRYAVTAQLGPVTVQGSLTADWPEVAGMTLTGDWGVQTTGAETLWISVYPSLAFADRLVAAIPAVADRLAIATAIDTARSDLHQVRAQLLLTPDQDALLGAATTGLALEQASQAAVSLLAAAGKPLDPIAHALLLTVIVPAAAPDAIARLAVQTTPPAGVPDWSLAVKARAWRALNLPMADAATALKTLYAPDATAMAQGLYGAYLDPSFATTSGLVAGLVARSASPADIGRLLQTLTVSSADAAAALSQAYATATGLQLPWAMVEAGIAQADVVAAATASLTPRVMDAAALAPLLAETFWTGVDPAMSATLANGQASALTAVKAHLALLQPLAAGARAVVLARAFRGTSGDLAVLAGCLALSGVAADAGQSALGRLTGASTADLSAAWANGASVAASLLEDH